MVKDIKSKKRKEKYFSLCLYSVPIRPYNSQASIKMYMHQSPQKFDLNFSTICHLHDTCTLIFPPCFVTNSAALFFIPFFPLFSSKAYDIYFISKTQKLFFLTYEINRHWINSFCFKFYCISNIFVSTLV